MAEKIYNSLIIYMADPLDTILIPTQSDTVS